MAWSSPSSHIYAVSELVTAATMNSYIEANLAFLYGDPAWNVIGVAAGFQNGWANTGGIYQTAGWRMIGQTIKLRGSIKSGTINTPAFTLPSVNRPPLTMLFACVSNSALGTLQVNNDGTVVPAIGSNLGFTLDTVFFDVIA